MPALQTISRNQDEQLTQSRFIDVIGRYGAPAKAAIPRLLEIALDAHNPDYLRSRATTTIGLIGPQAPEVVPGLIRILETANPNIGQTAIDALLRMKQQALPAVPALTATLDAKWDAFAAKGFSALGRLSAVEKPQTLEQALEVLRHLSETPPAERPPGEVAAAFQAVQEAREKGAVARPLLFQLLQSRPQLYVKQIALETLYYIGPGGGETVAKALLEATKISAIDNSAKAVLEKIDPTDASAVPPLVATLKDGKWPVRLSAAKALASFGKAAAPAIPVLIENLRNVAGVPGGGSKAADEVFLYINVLIRAEAGEQASQLMLDLLSPESPLMQKSNPAAREPLRGVLLQALACLGVPKDAATRALAMRYVAEGLQSNQANLFISAARVAETMGPEAAPAVPLLLAALRPGFAPRKVSDHNTPFFRVYYSGHASPLSAVRALAKIGKPAAEALPEIRAIAAWAPVENSYPTVGNTLHNELIKAAQIAQRTITGELDPSAPEAKLPPLPPLFGTEWLFQNR